MWAVELQGLLSLVDAGEALLSEVPIRSKAAFQSFDEDLFRLLGLLLNMLLASIGP